MAATAKTTTVDDKVFFVKMGDFVVGRKLEDGSDKVFVKIPGAEWPSSTRLDIVAIQDVFISMLRKLTDLGYDAVVAEDQTLAQMVESIKNQIRN